MNFYERFAGRLSGSVGNAMNNDPDDVRTTKRNLKYAGYFDTDNGEDDPENPILTRALDTRIKSYQADRNLKVDGILKPGGETERSLFETLTRRTSDDVFGPQERSDERIGFGGGFSNRMASAMMQPTDNEPRSPFALNFKTPERENERTSPHLRRVNEQALDQNLEGKPIEYDATGKIQRPKDREPLQSPVHQSEKHTIETFLPRIIGDEGVRHTTGKSAPNAIDPDGESKIGISVRTLNEYEIFKKSKGEALPSIFTKDPKKVTPVLAHKIYDEMYYKRYNIDKIKDKTIAGHVLDSSINPGPGYTAVWLQEELNKHLDEKIKVDGNIGSQTIRAIEDVKQKGSLHDVNNGLAQRRANHYKTIAAKYPKRSGFLPGWIERAESYTLRSTSSEKPEKR